VASGADVKKNKIKKGEEEEKKSGSVCVAGGDGRQCVGRMCH